MKRFYNPSLGHSTHTRYNSKGWCRSEKTSQVRASKFGRVYSSRLSTCLRKRLTLRAHSAGTSPSRCMTRSAIGREVSRALRSTSMPMKMALVNTTTPKKDSKRRCFTNFERQLDSSWMRDETCMTRRRRRPHAMRVKRLSQIETCAHSKSSFFTGMCWLFSSL